MSVQKVLCGLFQFVEKRKSKCTTKLSKINKIRTILTSFQFHESWGTFDLNSH